MLLMFLSGLLLVFSFPSFDWGWLAWVALVPWLFALEDIPDRLAWDGSFVVGLIFFGGTIWWVGHVTLLGTLLLVVYLALYFAAWGWLAGRLIRMGGFGRHSLLKGSIGLVLCLPAFWVLLEFVRSHLLTGFGWNLLGHSQWNWITLIQVVDLTGVAGISFLVVMSNVAIYSTLRAFFPRVIFVEQLDKAGKTEEEGEQGPSVGLLLAPGCIAWLVLFMVLTYGVVRFHGIGQVGSPTATISVVQGNVDQAEKWDEAFQEKIWTQYEQLTQESADWAPDLIVWPETAVPNYLDEPVTTFRLNRLVYTTQTPLLAGVAVKQGKNHATNSAVLFGVGGEILGRYNKLHLVPFGEYLPLEALSGFLRNWFPIGNFIPGDRTTVFDPSKSGVSKVPPFSVLICFEDLFPGLSRQFLRKGAKWLLVITNDAWFKRSPGSLQHLQASVFRAVEGRVWVVRAGNTGWSGFINPVGQRLPFPQQVHRFRPGVATAFLSESPADSLYVRRGDWFQLFCLILLGMGFIRREKSRKESQEKSGKEQWKL